MKNLGKILAAASFLVTAATAKSQTELGRFETSDQQLNLDFELNPEAGVPPQNWYGIRNGFTIVSDPTEHYRGSWSVRISSTSESKEFGALAWCLSADKFQGTVAFSGFIKTANVTDGWAGLWVRVDGANGEALGFDNMQGRGVVGSTEWRYYNSRVLDVPAAASKVCFGVLTAGRGTAWFDSLNIR